MSDRPTIGVTASLETVTSGPWTELSALVPFNYAAAVQRAGGRAILLVPDAADSVNPAELLALVDGLIVSGSAGDVDPARYGAERHPQTDPVVPERDEFELALVRAAAAGSTPLLGICRGMHVINVALGGTLVQHLPDELERDGHRGPPGSYCNHDVRARAGSVVARTLGGEHAAVRSYHHQGVGDVACSLRTSAWATEDDVVEAVEAPDHRFLLGVGWHPEEDQTSPVIATLVEEARR